jgi:hypothetical protein
MTRQLRSLKSSTASSPGTAVTSFEVTHVFHPKRGTRFLLATRRQNWGEDRVMYFDAQGRLRSMLASWTNLADEELFAQASAGRSWFRPDDLVQLCALLDELPRRDAP